MDFAVKTNYLHRDSKVDYRRLGADFRSVRRVRQLGGDVQTKALHDVNLLIAYFHLHQRKKKAILKSYLANRGVLERHSHQIILIAAGSICYKRTIISTKALIPDILERH